MFKAKVLILLLLSFCVLKTDLFLKAQNDSLFVYEIEDVFVDELNSSGLNFDVSGVAQWNIEKMSELPSLTGTVEPIRSLQLLPGVQTTAETTSGLYVQGCDNSHNVICLDGVPVYYPVHLLGFFSTFNPLHYQNILLKKNAEALSSNRLGASVNVMSYDALPEKVEGTVDLGLLSVQTTLSVPIKDRMGIILSGRYSNVNLLYDDLLNGKYAHRNIKYSFHDLNLKYCWSINSDNNLFFNCYKGIDNSKLSFKEFQIDSKLNWGNQTTSINWQRTLKNGMLDCVLYNTSYSNRIVTYQLDSQADVMSDISTSGFKVNINKVFDKSFLTYGLESQKHSILPQSALLSGGIGNVAEKQPRQSALEHSVASQIDYIVNNNLDISFGVNGSLYYNDNVKFNLDPNVVFNYIDRKNYRYSIYLGSKTQYLHQIGFSNNGLPTEYWIAANSIIPEQRLIKLSVGVEKHMLKSGFIISAELYSAYLKNQIESGITALDLITEKNNYFDNIKIGYGYNYGLDLMIQKSERNFDWWCAYSFSISPRYYDNGVIVEKFQSVNSRMHDMKLVGIWKLTSNWNLSTSFVYASGAPYTDIKSAVVLGENVVVNYGKHNGCKYPDYHRLDLSVQYKFNTSEGLDQKITLSINNATFAKNPIAYKYNKIVNNVVLKEAVYLFTTAVPSVSYSCCF